MNVKYYIIAYNKKGIKNYIQEKNAKFYLTEKEENATVFTGNMIYDKYQNKCSVFNYLKAKNKNLKFDTHILSI